jgi:hypothetical protein
VRAKLHPHEIATAALHLPYEAEHCNTVLQGFVKTLFPLQAVAKTEGNAMEEQEH